MLKLVFGRSGYGKSEYCFSEIKKLVLSGCNDVLLITPEQYNFTAEKKLLKMLGESKINSVQNLSFTRLCNEISRIYGKNTLPVLAAGAKAVLMKRAIGKVKENLKIFNKKTDSAAFIDSIIKIYDEMKFCDIDYSDFGNASEKIEQQVLSDKLYDISIILREYERSVNGKYSDSSDDLSELYNKLLKFGYLSGKYVFVDGFSGFASNEYKIIELIIKYSKEAVITVPTESYGDENRYSFFSYVNKTVDKIVKTAQEAKVKIETVMLSHNYRADNNYLKFCEKNIFSNGVKSIKEIPDSVRIYSAKSIEDECEYTAVKIKNLLKSGVRARDISVVCRDTNQYSGELSYSFKKYEIPYFDDERQPVKNQPLIVMVQYLLKTAIYSFRSEDIMSLAKTGLTNLSEQSVNSLENYIYIWNISGVKKWNKPFENSVKGFSCELSENDKAKLEAVNKSRKYLVSVINEFKYASKNANSAEISKAVYNALISFNANKNLKFLAKSLLKFGKNELALEQDRVWNLLMEILNDLAVVIGDEKITLKEYYELFNLIVSFEDLGVLPQGVDNVQFGRADRIRFDNPKAVFILGANEGEFPKASQDGGILSENDRLILNKNNLELYSFGETLNYQEQFFAYNAISAPRSFLYVTFLGNDKNSSPSIIVNS
ncbi:MAG: hypothetical protein LUG21_03585, partial [Clostridiales bacterium]|nr:hypothetical protein [Clostridiales bacterium]